MKSTLTIFVTLLMFQYSYAEQPLYGEVTLESGKSYQGVLRWGKEEAFASDHFNGNKIVSPAAKHLNEKQLDELSQLKDGPKATIFGLQFTFKKFFKEELDPPHFSLAMGGIRTITQNEHDQFIIELRNGVSFTTEDGSNDLTAKLKIKTESGHIEEFRMRSIQKIVFKPAPENIEGFGQPIYAVVKTLHGDFTGRVQWDHDERLSIDEIDGSENGKDYSIKFSEIISIEKKATGSLLKLKDGSNLSLTGTNDVNSDNRGIYIDNPDYGRIDISWENFINLTMTDTQPDWRNYTKQLAQSKKLSATIRLKDGSSHQGDIIYEMHQIHSSEFLDGTANDMKRSIPFFMIKSIKVNQNNSEITLKSGKKLNMYGHRGVSSENKGLVVIESENATWLKWQQIDLIEFPQ